MATITLKGNAIHTSGELPQVGTPAPAFTLTGGDLRDRKNGDYAGKTLVLNIFPSIDTPVCAASTQRFNAEAAGLANTAIACVSADLPFAFKRFCAVEGLEGVETLSTFRHAGFGATYGVQIVDGGLAGLLARAVVVVDGAGKVTYTELVPEIGQEPDYAAALEAARKAGG